jgi:tRNA(Ile)-lysidine synthase
LSREETRRYCEESGVVPRDDPTNELLIATRNRVRHEVMPLLRTFNPRIDEALCRLADSAAEDTAYLDELAAGQWSTVTFDEECVQMGRKDLAALPEAIAARLVRMAAAHLGAPVPQAEHVEQVLAAARRGSGTIELPGGIVAAASASLVSVRRP